MTRERHLLRISLAVCAAVIVGYAVLWLQVTRVQIGRSDFTSTYIGATLLREGHGSAMYDEALQAPLHRALIAPDREGNLPFVNPPLAAALALPITFLTLSTAYRVWSAVQWALLVLSAVIAVRAAPGSRRVPTTAQWAFVAVSLAGVGSVATLLLGQWDGLAALGLALTYASIRRDRPLAAGALFAATALIAKPHLVLALAVFVVARRERRLIVGIVVGATAAAAASLVVAGPGGIAGFIGAIGHSTTRWQLANMVSAVGIGGSIFANSVPAYVLAGSVAVTAIAAAALLGGASRTRGPALEAALAGATILSLVAAPHAYWDDLALLVPALAWSLCALQVQHAKSRLWAATTGVWVAISLAAYLDIAGLPKPWGSLTPWALILGAALAITTCVRLLRTEGPFSTFPSGLEQATTAPSPSIAITGG